MDQEEWQHTSSDITMTFIFIYDSIKLIFYYMIIIKELIQLNIFSINIICFKIKLKSFIIHWIHLIGFI